MKNVLVIYTGGTIGMVKKSPVFSPTRFNFDELRGYLPELERLKCNLYFTDEITPIDSANITPSYWLRLARIITKSYSQFDGFVVLHGTDTMAYTASVLSFLLGGLHKPVVLTGAQLPLDAIRSDARVNLITALEIASHPEYVVPEVSIFFSDRLLRGNRAIKYSSEHFEAFTSPNYPDLVRAGLHLNFFPRRWLPASDTPFNPQLRLDPDVGLLKFYPGISFQLVDAYLSQTSYKAVVIESFGAGNIPSAPELLSIFERHIKRGLVMVNVTQCIRGRVEQGLYETSLELQNIGVVSGADITVEAAIVKLMHLLAIHENQPDTVRTLFRTSLRGELTDQEPR